MDLRKLSFQDAPVIKIEPPGPKSKEILDYQFSHEGAAVSYPRGLPMALKRGRGATVEDVDGNIYLDFFGGAGVLNVGHSHPVVIQAAADQIWELTHSLDIPNPPRKALVENLFSVLPNGIDKVFFGGPTGSDAVEAAVKLAKINTKRTGLISFEGGYHGMTAGALSLTSGYPFKEGLLPGLPDIHFIPYAYCYRCAFNRHPDSCGLECAQYLEHKLEDPHSGAGKPAAVIVEAVQGEGGTIVPPNGFLPRIRELCNKYEVLLIIDEIQAGFCRTGKMFALEHTHTIPDIMTMSKALGGVGFPISCIAYNQKLDTWPPGKHIGTFRGNVIAYAAGNAALTFMKEEDLAGHVTALGDKMLSRLKNMEAKSEIIGDVRGKGLMLGVELVEDKSSKKPAPKLARDIRTLCHRRGLLIEIGGHYFNVARFLPPLVLTADLADKGLDIFAESVELVEKSR
jgi:diaminobutyrate-2-oxoglutarate transaminase